MIVYITTNLINNKKYIGKDEKNCPTYLGSGLQLMAAIKKYGKDNFRKEVVETADSKEELEILEEFYIKKFDAQNSKDFYNIAPGGTGGRVAKDYGYREKSVLEIDSNNNVIKRFKSGKEASIITGLSYKNINAVCNGSKRFIDKRIFIFESRYNVLSSTNKKEDYYTFKYFLSLRTGIFYNRKDSLWKAEFSHFTRKSFYMRFYRGQFKDEIVF